MLENPSIQHYCERRFVCYGEQWICRCGAHNFFQRQRCRECGAYKTVASVRTESVGEVMGYIEEANSGKKVFGADNQQGSSPLTGG